MPCFRLTLIALLLFGPMVGICQEWLSNYQKAQELYEQEEYPLAFVEATAALEKYVSSKGEANDNYASLLRLASNICYSMDKIDEGLAYSLDEIKIRETTKDVLLATAFSNAAQFYRQKSAYPSAIDYFQRGLAIFKTFYPPDQQEVVAEELNLATTHYLAGEYQEAYHQFTGAFKKNPAYDLATLTGGYYFGLVQMELGRVEESIVHFLSIQQQFETNKLTETIEYALLLQSLADAYHQYQLFFKAEENFQKAQGILEALGQTESENYYDLLNGRAVNLEALGKPLESEKMLATLKGKPNSQQAYALALTNSAALSQLNGNLEQAEQRYRESLSLFDRTTREGKVGYAEGAERLAVLLAETKKYEEAVQFINESNQLLTEAFTPNHIRIASSLNSWGAVLLKSNKSKEAAHYFLKTIGMLESTGPQPAKIIALAGLAQCYQNEGAFLRADSLYQLAFSFYETNQLKADRNYVPLVTAYAASAQVQGNLNFALRLLNKALAFQRAKTSHRDNINLALLLEDAALLNLQVGNRQVAKAALDSASMLMDNDLSRKTKEYATLQLSFGKYHQMMGEFPKAEKYLRQGLELTKAATGENSESYVLALNGMALLYQTMGNYADAEPLLRNAIQLQEQLHGKMNAEYATVLQNLASLFQLKEELDKAEPLLREALEIDRQLLGEAHPKYTISLQNLATLYQKKKQFNEAATLMEQIKKQMEATWGKRHPSYATVVSNLAALKQDLGEYAMSESLWKESVEVRKQLLGEDHPDYARSLYGLASIEFATGQWEAANIHFTQVVGKYQNQIASYFQALSEKEKGAFYSRIKPVFETYQDFCVQMITQKKNVPEMTTQLLNLQLSTKAILLNASNKVRAAIQASGDNELLALFSQWQQSKEDLVRFYSYSKEERDHLHIDIHTLEVQSNDLEKQLSEKSVAFSSQLGNKNISWKEVQQQLTDQEAAIEIIRIRKKFVPDSVYYVALITRKDEQLPRLLIWPYGTKMENRGFRFHRNAIKFHLPDTLSYAYFWAPLAKALPTVQTLYFSCDGVFNKINFNTLQNPTNKKWVLDDYSIRLLSNTRELTEKHLSEKKGTTNASIFGYADFNLAETDKATHQTKRATRFGFEGEDIPMLPATEKEVNLLQEVLRTSQWTVNSFTLSNATEKQMKEVQNPQILHIATHGFFLSDVDISDQLESDRDTEPVQNPLFRSGLLLAGASLKQEPGQEDGVLTAYEAMNLNLDQTELVSLSACETGLGEVRNGEGVYGLQRSFLVAGARTVIMSLWQVDDTATQELMSSFYKSWLGGADKFLAFRLAQQEIKERYKEPYYWGAFVLIGN